MSDSFKHETVQDLDSILAYLDALKQGLQRGALTLKSAKGALEMSPSGLLDFTVEAKSKDGRNKLVLKLAWKDAATDGGAEDAEMSIAPR